MMNIEYLINQGVAISVLLWFMLRMEKIINKNTSAINSLADLIKKK